MHKKIPFKNNIILTNIHKNNVLDYNIKLNLLKLDLML